MSRRDGSEREGGCVCVCVCLCAGGRERDKNFRNKRKQEGTKQNVGIELSSYLNMAISVAMVSAGTSSRLKKRGWAAT